MRNAKLFVFAMLAIAMVPGVASATHLNGVVFLGDGNSWTAQVSVTWRDGIYAGDLDFALTLLDGETVLEEYAWEGPLSRAESDPQDMIYTFEGNWSESYPGPVFRLLGTFHLVAPWDGGLDDETSEVDVQLPNLAAAEVSTWGIVKALFE